MCVCVPINFYDMQEISDYSHIILNMMSFRDSVYLNENAVFVPT